MSRIANKRRFYERDKLSDLPEKKINFDGFALGRGKEHGSTREWRKIFLGSTLEIILSNIF